MMTPYSAWLTCLLLFGSGDPPKDAWARKLADATRDQPKSASVDDYRKVLDLAWRADDWQEAERLARAALKQHEGDSELSGYAARAFWRAGRMQDAEALIDKLATTSDDPVALDMVVTVGLARCENAMAAKAGAALERLKSPTATDLNLVLAVRIAQNRYDGVIDLLRQVEKLTNVANGYPETYIGETLEGLPEFFKAVGTQPVNQIATHGAAAMPVTPLINLPGCAVYINGNGPYQMIVDTGGSIMLSIDDEVAAECGIKSIVSGSIRGVSGKDTAGQAIIDDLQIGDIRCKRVMTRIFGVRMAAAGIDGIIGTGIFSQGRMTLDLENARLVVAPSSDAAGKGQAATVRIVGDSKLMTPVTVNGAALTALLDSGADVVAISPSRLRKLFPDKEIPTIRTPMAGVGAGEQPEISISAGVTIEFAGRKFPNYSGLGLDVLDTTLSPILGVQSDVLIGMPFFRDMKSFTIDYARARMWVDWLERK